MMRSSRYVSQRLTFLRGNVAGQGRRLYALYPPASAHSRLALVTLGMQIAARALVKKSARARALRSRIGLSEEGGASPRSTLTTWAFFGTLARQSATARFPEGIFLGVRLCEGDFTPIIAHSAAYGVQISSHLSPCSTSLSRSFLLSLRTVIDLTKEFVCLRCVALSHSPSLSS